MLQLNVAGHTVYAYTGGRAFDPQQPTVAFVHGAQHDHSVWTLQSRYLAHHGFSVLAFDLPGHGRSGGTPLGSIEQIARWLLHALDAAEVQHAHLVGHSMGSLVALEAAGTAPERAASLALIATAFPMRVSDELLAAARDDESRAIDMINAWSHSTLAHAPGCPGPGFSVFVQNRRLMQRQRPGTLWTDFAACNDYEGGLARARALCCPVLFVLAARDAMTPPKAARALIDLVDDARVLEVANCGHALMTERPDAVLDALRGFLPAARPADRVAKA